jgi:hypothetical protein
MAVGSSGVLLAQFSLDQLVSDEQVSAVDAEGCLYGILLVEFCLTVEIGAFIPTQRTTNLELVRTRGIRLFN